MAAIPTSDMPGHQQLHDRVTGALDRCQESQSVDFKESATWDTLKWRIVRTLMAMANLRDGGIVVVGAGERNETWDLDGIESKHLQTYEVDKCLDFVNKYADPPLRIDIVRVTHSNGNEFLAFQVAPFEHTPCICKKTSADNGKYFRKGGVLVRPAGGRARTERISNAEDMREMLHLAAVKRAREMIESAGQIGLLGHVLGMDLFDKELGGL